jgi:predicted DNA-binding protein
MSRPKYPSDSIAPFGLRMPPEMKAGLEAEARANGRSLNAEIIHRLQSHNNPEGGDMAKGNALTIRISDETKEKLDRLSKRGPYRISITSIVERGIELAAAELEALK